MTGGVPELRAGADLFGGEVCVPFVDAPGKLNRWPRRVRCRCGLLLPRSICGTWTHSMIFINLGSG